MDPQIPPLLRDYRLAHANPAPNDSDAPMLKKIKAQFHNEFDKFLAAYQRLEAQYAPKAEAEKKQDQPAEVDQGHDAAMKAALDWLRENGVQQ